MSSSYPGGSPSDYPLSDPLESGSMADQGRCCSDKICNCLGGSLESIAQSAAIIAQYFQDKLSKPCDKIMDCMDKIEEELRKRFKEPLATCEECKAMIEQGLSGSVEYAVRCAGACIEKARVECSPGSPESWGKPCEGCGEPCCECHTGNCEPVDCPPEPEKKKEHKYIGWCNRESGTIVVTRDDALPPGVGYMSIALGDDEEAVAVEAQKNCQPYIQRGEQVEQGPTTAFGTAGCDIAAFYNGEALSRLASQQAGTNQVAGQAQANKAVLTAGFEGINAAIAGDAIYGAVRAFLGIPGYMAEQSAPALASAVGCNNSQWMQGLLLLNSLSTTSKWTGLDISEFTTSIRYAMNAACRQRLLDPDKAIAAYLAGSIGPEMLDAHWGVNNLCPESVKQYVEAARSKPVPLQLAMMRRRKLIEPSDYHKGMRQIGYLDPGPVENLFKLTEQLPTLSDITRLMVRDADDEQLAQRLNLDAYFDQKYGAQLKEWSEAQGVPEKFARYYWRAHWNIPSPGQLFTFYHRLRNNPQFGGPGKVLEDIKAALIQQDILPYWHEHYLATSFLPLGRIDIRRAYNVGSLKFDDLMPAYSQLGYSDENATQLAKFTKRLRDVSLPNHRAIKLWVAGIIDSAEAQQRMLTDGIEQESISQAMRDAEAAFERGPLAQAYTKAYIDRDVFVTMLVQRGVSNDGASRIADTLALKRIDNLPIKDYVAGSVDRVAVENEMKADGLHPSIASHLLDIADRAIDNAFVISCQRGIKKRYLYGELSADEATAELTNRGTTLTRAQRLVDWWQCEKSSTGKAVTAAKLCHWLSIGAIQSVDFTSRLRKLGYSEADAALMLDDCLMAISLKRLATAKKESKEQAAIENRAAAALRRQQAFQQRQLAALARAAANSQKARIDREKQLLSVGQKLAKKCTCELFEALQAAKDNYSRIKREFGLSADETLQAMLLAAEEWQGGNLSTFADDADEFAKTAAGVEPATV